mmetsp:Transcript_41926/g.91300  ORF Transcript_41926/g.91300 Transcript_41926/m.91300 type:complete len:165 (-) Transcript_41926:38-532(-)
MSKVVVEKFQSQRLSGSGCHLSCGSLTPNSLRFAGVRTCVCQLSSVLQRGVGGCTGSAQDRDAVRLFLRDTRDCFDLQVCEAASVLRPKCGLPAITGLLPVISAHGAISVVSMGCHTGCRVGRSCWVFGQRWNVVMLAPRWCRTFFNLTVICKHNPALTVDVVW